MKKMLAFVLVLVMGLSLVACGGSATPTEPTEPAVSAPASALEVLQNIWAQYGEDEKFPVMGGNPEGGAMEPAVWDAAFLTDLCYSLQLTEADMESVADAATMIHMMNANTFTGAVLNLNEGVDKAAFAATAKDAVMNAQWMCGFPETLIIADMGGQYLLMAYGVNDAMGPFEAKLTEAYPTASVLYNEAIAG